MTTKEKRQTAREALEEYRTKTELGLPAKYPHWADDVLADEVTEGETNG